MPVSAKKLATFCGVTDTVISPHFRGLYPIDKLDTVESFIDFNKINCLIVYANSHFFALFIDMQHKKANAFIDSMARQPKTYGLELEEFMQYFMTKYASVPFRVQSQSSDICAAYCVYFLHQMADGKPLKEAMKLFLPNQYKQNDAMVLGWMKKNFSRSNVNDLFSDLR